MSSGYNCLIRYGTEKQGGLPALAPWVVGMCLGVTEAALITKLATAASAQEHGFGSCAAVPRALAASSALVCHSVMQTTNDQMALA